MKRFVSAKSLIGGFLVVLFVLIAIITPLVIPPEYATKMMMAARLHPPSTDHLLGADQLGRDLFYRVILGTRTR
jgi:ABC-type dipeptide/oligopeptide/nickel transport system permease subunit